MSDTTKRGVNRNAMFALIKSMVKDGLLSEHTTIEDAPGHYEKIENAILAYEENKTSEKPNILCGECLSKDIKKEGDLYVCQNCGYSSEILDSSLQDIIKATNDLIGSMSSGDN